MSARAALIRRLLKGATVLCLILAVGAARAQPDPHEPVGANEIFDVLTRPDAPTDLQLLRALRQSLASTPDPKTLNDMRAQLDALLRDAERRQGDLPPALVMSGIATRIDGAITRLETARPPPVVQAPQGPPWLLPALAGLCGTLAIGLAACLAVFASQAKVSDENNELHEALTRLRRRLDEMAAGAGHSSASAGAARDVASEALQETSATVTRLGHSAKEAESQLRISTEAAEQRLQGAASIAGQLEIWLQTLPSRLGVAIAQVEGGEPGRREPGAPPFAAQALLLPDLVGSLQAACDNLRDRAEAFTLASLANTPPAADIAEYGQSAALATEMTHLAFGHALKLDDVIIRIADATEGLPELVAALRDAAATLPEQIERNASVTESFQDTTARAQATLAQLSLFIEERLPKNLAAMADIVSARGIAALEAAAEHFADIASTAAQAAAEMPQNLGLLHDAAATLSQTGATQQAVLAEANQRLSYLTEILPEAGASLAAASDALKQQSARETKRTAASRAAINEIALAAQAARADLAAATDAATAIPAQTARLAELLAQGEAFLARLEARATEDADSVQRARDAALAGVELAIGKVQAAAERLNAGADAQDQALARVRRAALTVATLAGADSMHDSADPTARLG